MGSRTKADYGLDAPGLVKFFLLLGIIWGLTAATINEASARRAGF